MCQAILDIMGGIHHHYTGGFVCFTNDDTSISFELLNGCPHSFRDIGAKGGRL